jgi:hypothetical protein
MIFTAIFSEFLLASHASRIISKLNTMNGRNSDQHSRFDTMVLRPALAECPVDSNTSKRYIIENHVSSRVLTNTIPYGYLSTCKEVAWKTPSPAARKSGRSRVSFKSYADQECCVFDPQFPPNSITKCQSAAVKIQAQARRAIQSQRYLRVLIAKVEKEIHALCERAAAMKFEAAATTMQAFGRGSMCRVHFQIKKQEFRLLQSDRLLKTQLEEIQKEKKRQVEAIYDESSKKMDKKEKKDKTKKDKKAMERSAREDKLPQLQEEGSMTSLDFSHNGSSCSLDAGSGSCCQDYTRYECKNLAQYYISSLVWAKQAEQLRMMKVEEEHTRKREERRRKREESEKMSMSDAEDTRGVIIEAHRDDRLKCAFLWYTRMAGPSRKEFKRQIATQVSMDITAEDVDLLTWNKTGTRVVNISSTNTIIRTRMLEGISI